MGVCVRADSHDSDDVMRMYGLDVPLSSVPHVFRVALTAYKSATQNHKHQVRITAQC